MLTSTVLSLGLGYLLGSINPAAIVGRINRVDLTQEGTGNLGTTNTLLVLGPSWAVIVLVFDIFKSWLSARLARIFFPQLVLAGLLACLGALIGHCFPLFFHFQGGRGLAVFGGMILSYHPGMFLLIVAAGVAMMLALDAGVAATFTGCVLFPLLVRLNGGGPWELGLAVAAGTFLGCMHLDKLALAVKNRGGDRVLETLKEKLFGMNA